MPTGLSDSPMPTPFGSNLPKPGSERVPQPATNRQFTAVVPTGAGGVPQNCVSMRVGPSDTVRVRGGNGKTAGNSGTVFAALYREGVLNGGGDPITPDTEIIYPIDHTGQIWFSGAVGDGIVVSVRANPT